MKRVLFAGLLMVAVSAASFSRELIATGKTHTSMGDYKLEVTDPVTINNEEFKAFLISYENSPMQVKVVVMKGKNCKDYVVISDKLCIKYVCNKDYFGVEKLNPESGFKTSDEWLNRTQYFHQRKITDGGNSEFESAKLIAAFFPLLLNDEAAGAI